MKKLIIFVIVAGAVVGSYWYISKHARVSLTELEGRTVKVHRGDLNIPITASGNIRPASVTQIKSKASGEVIAIPFEIGAMVKKGDIVVQLLDVDERNARDRAKADRDRARIELDKAKIAKRQAEEVGIPAAEAKVAQADARLQMAKWDFDKQKELRALDVKEGRTLGNMPPSVLTASTPPSAVAASMPAGMLTASNLEFMMKEASWKEAEATKRATDSDLAQAKIAVEQAQKTIETGEEALNTAQKALDDAEERLRETIVRSPIDGMVLSRNVQIGEVVQSGKTMFTGGTVLMEIADVGQIYAVVNVDEADIGQVRDLAPPSARPGETATRPALQPRSQLAADPDRTPEHPVTLPAGTLEQGEPVEVTVESFKDRKFEGLIERIAPQSEVIQAIAKFKVWIRITSADRNDLVGLLNTQAEAHFTARSVRDALLVSCDAMQKDPQSDALGVFLKTFPPGKVLAEPKFVRCEFGPDNGIDVQVKKGLKDGEEVYTKLPLKTERQRQAEEKEKA